MELSESGSTSVTAAALGSDTSLREEETVGVRRKGWEKIGFHSIDSLRAQGQYWSVIVFNVTNSHLVISLLSLPALVLHLLSHL